MTALWTETTSPPIATPSAIRFADATRYHSNPLCGEHYPVDLLLHADHYWTQWSRREERAAPPFGTGAIAVACYLLGRRDAASDDDDVHASGALTFTLGLLCGGVAVAGLFVIGFWLQAVRG